MNLQQSVSRIIAALNEAGLDYMLVGSFSSMYYSFPRSTTDADFVIGTADFDIQSLSNSLGSEFKFDPFSLLRPLVVRSRMKFKSWAARSDSSCFV